MRPLPGTPQCIKIMLICYREAGAIVLKIAYGYTIEPHGSDPLVDLADKGMEDFSFALLPATWAVEFLPICKWSLVE